MSDRLVIRDCWSVLVRTEKKVLSRKFAGRADDPNFANDSVNTIVKAMNSVGFLMEKRVRVLTRGLSLSQKKAKRLERAKRDELELHHAGSAQRELFEKLMRLISVDKVQD
jgi:hypothetical protein